MKRRKEEEEFEAFEEWEEEAEGEPEEEFEGEPEGEFDEEEGFAEEEEEEEFEAAPEEEPEPESEPESEPEPEPEAQIEEEPEPEPKAKAPQKFSRAAFDLAPDVPVQVIAVMGKRGITMKELMELRMGQVIDLKRPPNETVDIVVNGRLFARGELVEIDGKLGVKIIKLVR